MYFEFCAHKTDLVQLDIIQHNALRIVTGCIQHSNIKQMYFDTNWQSLENRRKYVLVMIYKICNGLAPKYLTDIMPQRVLETVPYNVRNRNNFIIPFCRVLCFRQSFIPLGASAWNKLDENVRSLKPLPSFKTGLKNYLNEQIIT